MSNLDDAKGWQDRVAITRLIDAYAEAVDRRQFENLDTIFAEDIEFDYGPGWQLTGRKEAADRIAESLSECGPTQHFIGNYRIEVDGDRATARSYTRAFHVGIGAAKGLTYEMGGHTRDEFSRIDGEWRMTRRVGRMIFETGSTDVLAPSSMA